MSILTLVPKQDMLENYWSVFLETSCYSLGVEHFGDRLALLVEWDIVVAVAFHKLKNHGLKMQCHSFEHFLVFMCLRS